jgi:hypothetical protein
MSFSDFLNKSWNDHAKDAAAVATRWPEGISLLEKNEQIPSFANLITHVMGEHLGEWSKGIETLNQLRSASVFDPASESEGAIQRSVASLEVAGGLRQSLEGYSTSEQIRILAVAASALSEKDAKRAQELFRSALSKAGSGLTKEDPANRSLAITGNNLACALEEKSSRSAAETELMIMAAQTGRHFWAVAGGWLETERAEYRLSQTYLKAAQPELAVSHAKKCLEICSQNKAGALEVFFGYETLALAEKSAGNTAGFNLAVQNAEQAFTQLTDDEKPWCEASLKKLKD